MGEDEPVGVVITLDAKACIGAWAARHAIQHRGVLLPRAAAVPLNGRCSSSRIAPVAEHCEKPEEVYRRIERLYPGPRLELFARRPRAGWTVWGNEIERDRFNEAARAEPEREHSDDADDIPDFLLRARRGAAS